MSDVAGRAEPQARPLGRVPSAAPGARPPNRRTISWRGWPGGVAMVIGCLAPEALLQLGRPGELRFRVGENLVFDLGWLLASSPSIAVFTVVAPLVGYRRRDALLMMFPIPNLYLSWVAGARMAQLRPGDAPGRWVGSREANAAAVIIQCVACAAYLAWTVVFEIAALP